MNTNQKEYNRFEIYVTNQSTFVARLDMRTDEVETVIKEVKNMDNQGEQGYVVDQETGSLYQWFSFVQRFDK